MVIHTPGGLALAANQIAQALANRQGKVTVIVPHYALSGGTVLSLASDEIIMDPNAVLGRADPQTYGLPAVSVSKVLKQKDLNKIKDQILILGDLSQKAVEQMKNFTQDLLNNKDYSEQEIENIINELTSGKYTHDYPLTFDDAKKLGLKVADQVPDEVYQLMELYPQPRQRQSDVQYIRKSYQNQKK